MQNKTLTPSLARTINWSLDVRVRCEISGMAMIPWSLSMKSPKARDMARPGEFSLGNHTRWICGSSFRANTRPLQLFMRSASPAFQYTITNIISRYLLFT